MTRTGGAPDRPAMPTTADRVMARDVADAMAAVLRALADPLRLQIVSVLATHPGGRVPAGQVAGITVLTPPTVSHHLRSLREAGVVVAEREGTRVLYSLAPGMDRVAAGLLNGIASSSHRAWRSAPAALPAPGEPPVPSAQDVEAFLDAAAGRLRDAFPQLEPDLVTRTVRASYADLGRTATVTERLPELAERFAGQRLADVHRAGARATEAAPATPQVLFVCVANAGRSQLAAALLRRYAGDAVVVRSAGSLPAGRVHASVEPVLGELLAELGDHDPPFPKPLTDDAVRAADVVVTMGCGDSCPVLPGTRYEDWPVGDPALASPAGVRAVVADLETRVRALADSLTRPTGPRPTARPAARPVDHPTDDRPTDDHPTVSRPTPEETP